MRIDKWLCYVRVFKTRTLASEACRGNLVKIGGEAVKASREIVANEVISIEKDIAVRKARVLDFPPRRVSAKLVDAYREDLTEEAPPRSKFDFLNEPPRRRPSGRGRPTKKERREIDSILSQHDP
jgi:ribosome-associated heat shock protein Hsp15